MVCWTQININFHQKFSNLIILHRLSQLILNFNHIFNTVACQSRQNNDQNPSNHHFLLHWRHTAKPQTVITWEKIFIFLFFNDNWLILGNQKLKYMEPTEKRRISKTTMDGETKE
jgi:hypothetical protein